ncbi:MAG: hypothetical protein JWM81_484 [Candidatus Saccharibacteria bacterium]|nr:hypothetical protein [Candidatus Saccharibacteria bacterium]
MTDPHFDLNSNDIVTNHHDTTLDSVLHDIEQSGRDMAIDALVASQDCHIMLATALDQYVHNHFGANDQLPGELEDVIRTLLYLQRHYSLVSKKSDYRQ